MAAQRVSSHDDIMRDFAVTVQECERKAACGRHFICVEKLKSWMYPQVEGLLDAAYRRQNYPGLPIHPRTVRRRDNDSLLVLSILLELDRGDLIDSFYELGLVAKLPVDLATLKARLRGDNKMSDSEAESLAERFDEKQWRYCAEKFYLDARRNYVSSNQIIPISRKEAINTKGGTATVWQIEVLEEFVEESLRSVVSTSRFKRPNDDLGYRYNFALKVFQDGHKVEYDNEIRAFQALEGHDGVIRYLGDYRHRDHSTGKLTYNILLEFGELDLDEFFFDPVRLPPVLPNEVQGFWKELFEVAAAVKDIHTFERRRGEMKQEYYGWHADIKPDNILRVKGRFKLADPGFAKFEKSEAFERFGKRDHTTMIRGGTITYGAPECHPGRDKRVPVPRSIDIWSLGCVFSVAASWVVLGAQGIVQFIYVRQKAISKILPPGAHPSAEKPKADYFHDGEEVLGDVLDWHDHLRRTCRRTDTITSKVLDLVDQGMLRGDAQNRIEAADLCSKLEQILAQSPGASQTSLSESLREALIEMDKQALSQPSPSKGIPGPASALLGLNALDDRKIRKSRLLDLPLMKTTHRSEALKAEPVISGKSARYPDTARDSHQEKILASADASTPPNSASRAGGKRLSTTPSNTVNHHPHQRSPSGHSKRPRTGTSTTSTNRGASRSAAAEYGVQNVWQARLEVERRKNILGMTKKEKDRLLTQHFGDRDIIFLVDNAESMAEFWDEAIYLLETLVMKAQGQDENGMDLAFFNGPIKLKGSNKPAKFKEKMEDPLARPSSGNGIHTDIRNPLGEIFFDYLQTVRGSRKRVRKLTVIIFTDGKWEGIANKHEVNNLIVDFAKNLERAQGNSLLARQVTFEFVRFGFDSDAKYRLEQLDDELPFEGVPDLVDTEHSRGNVIKMLLGSFVEEYDDKKSDDMIIVPMTPTSRSSYFDNLARPISSDQNLSMSPPQIGEASPPGLNHVQRTDTAHIRSASGAEHPPPELVLPYHSRNGSGGYGRYP